MLDIQLFGQFYVQVDGAMVSIPSRLAQSLLARLALTPGIMHRRERLAGEFWPDMPETNARNNLRHALWTIRSGLKHGGAVVIQADKTTAGLPLDANLRVDALELVRVSGDPCATTADLVSAAGLYRAELLPGFYDAWVDAERLRMRVAFEQLMQRLLTRLSVERRWSEVVQWGTHWFIHGESGEIACRALMTAHHARGSMDGVHAVYRQCASNLEHEMGVEPSDETRALYRRLVQTIVSQPKSETNTAPFNAGQARDFEREASASAPQPLDGLSKGGPLRGHGHKCPSEASRPVLGAGPLRAARPQKWLGVPGVVNRAEAVASLFCEQWRMAGFRQFDIIQEPAR